jgi:glycolate oxidase iron-sulfur subunit
LLGTGRLLRPLLPAALAERVPARQAVRRWPARSRSRQVLLLAGCVQPALAPNINGATARVLDALGIEVIVPESAGCCGAVRHHLGDPGAGLDDARRNIDAWWPRLEAGIDAIVVNASGCGSQVREYGHLLRHDAAYAARAARVSAAACDVAELVAACVPQLQAELGATVTGRVVFHPPCTLQHGQKVRGAVESLLSALGAEVLPFADGQLCCGGAGTYAMLQPVLATGLRERKLEALLRAGPDEILTANIGCIAHLGVAAGIPVRHWIEWVDDALWARHAARGAGQGESG